MRPAARRATLRTAAKVACAKNGLGLFTGRSCGVELRPAEAGAGLAFVVGGVRIGARIENLSREPVAPAFAGAPPRHTVLAAGGRTAVTTEHALAALVGSGITDAEIVLGDGDSAATLREVPIDDGSAMVFARAVRAAGTEQLGAPADVLVVREPVRVEDGRGGVITAEPAAATDFSYALDYGPGSPLPPQSARWGGGVESFAAGVAPARTFSLRAEAEAMHNAGLFTGFAPADLPVVDDDGSLIDNAWRFDDEPARHKLLDLIGDLALVGRPILGRVSAARSGHALNHAMARELVARFAAV